MNLVSIYKPNSKNSGHAMSVSISKDFDDKNNKVPPSIMVEIVKQSSWDNSKKQGSFKHPKGSKGKKTLMKLTDSEVGDILYSIEKGKTFSAFHKFGDSSKSIKIVTEGTERKIKGQDSETVRLVKFGITENSIGFYLLLTAGESQLFLEALRFGLSKIFNSKNNA